MNDSDLQFEIGIVLYRMYLKVIPVATEAQSELADKMYHFLLKEQKKCDLYKNSDIPKPENYIHKIIRGE